MSNAFEPKLEILPESQRRLWPELVDVPKSFTLYGGTAIALRLGHRQSVDFDFFGSEAFDPDERRARPMARRDLITARPARVIMRARKPCI